MKQKLKEKFNVADKVKKTSFTKCVKMSKEVENLKNGVLNGDSVITNHTQQQQYKKLNNSNVDTTTKAIVGGRLQFYKDGKFILELARAREGEKTGWISVPRKTFWPPTISTNSSTTFAKHESSTSLSYSDDNSSVQSSPWQRDHCWKQSRPRQNISKELTFFYNRPCCMDLTDKCKETSRLMRRRPLLKCNEILMKFIRKPTKRKEDDGESEVTSTSDSNKPSGDGNGNKESVSLGSTSPNDSNENEDTLDGEKCLAETKKVHHYKLDKILKKLADKMSFKLALNGSASNGHSSHNHTVINKVPTSYSLASHIVNSINSTQVHQHVSPRKRILRELEKVTLEDTKRSRSKSINLSSNAISNGQNNSKTTEKAPPPISRPISSYSITSLLAHNTSSCNNSNVGRGSTGCNSNINSNASNNNKIDSLSTSHYQQQHQRVNSSNPSPPPNIKSPPLMNSSKQKSPNLFKSNRSPSHSPPSPEHHAFHKYRPNNTTPTSIPASSSPYSSSYPSPNYLRGSPSPHDRLRTTGNFQNSPNSHYATSSPQQNFNMGSVHRDTSLSPNVDKNSSNNRTTPTNIPLNSSGIRNVPKKTAALRQQFSSPTMEKSIKSVTPAQNNEKSMEVDILLRPSTLIPPPISAISHHPATPITHYPYIYPPINYLPPSVPPYYPSFYNPAMLAAAAAAYRFPIPSYPVQPSSTLSTQSNSLILSSGLKNEKNSIGNSRIPTSTPLESSHHQHSYVPMSPWSQIDLSNHQHPINDGSDIIPKGKDEPSSDVPLNLSKH